jgi:hypothetical protein
MLALLIHTEQCLFSKSGDLNNFLLEDLRRLGFAQVESSEEEEI